MTTVICNSTLDCFIEGYNVTMEDDGNGNFALYISGNNCRIPEVCQSKRVLYYVLHQYLLAADPEAASLYENCCCATGGKGHTYYHRARRLVQPVEGVTPPAEAVTVFAPLPPQCDTPLFEVAEDGEAEG